MNRLNACVFALLLGCQLPPEKEAALDFIVIQESPEELKCTLVNNSSDIYMVTGRQRKHPVPDTEYWIDEEWVVDNIGWCHTGVNLFQLNPGESTEFIEKVKPLRPVRLSLDVGKVVFNVSDNGSIESYSTLPSRIVGRLSNQPLQRTSR